MLCDCGAGGTSMPMRPGWLVIDADATRLVATLELEHVLPLISVTMSPTTSSDWAAMPVSCGRGRAQPECHCWSHTLCAERARGGTQEISQRGREKDRRTFLTKGGSFSLVELRVRSSRSSGLVRFRTTFTSLDIP
eukprot:2506543-Prymnesium_polylepis.1